MDHVPLHLTHRGGAPGHPSLAGPRTLPRPDKPKRLVRLDTPGWQITSDDIKAVYEDYLRSLAQAGVEIIGRNDDSEIEEYEKHLVELRDVMSLVLTYEGRYPLAMFADRKWDLLSERVQERVVAGRKLTPEDYAKALEWCISFRVRHAALRERTDGFITLNQIDPAPLGMPVGDVVYGEASSIHGSPALNLPLLAIDGMPLGIQLLGFYREDYKIVANAHWLVHTALGVDD